MPPGAVPLNLVDAIHCRLMLKKGRAADVDFALVVRKAGAPPGVGDVRQLLSGAADRIPALGYRIAGRGRRSHFEPVPVDVNHHIEELCFPPGRSVEACVKEAVERPWSADRPLWRVQIISGYTSDEHLLVYRVCHVLQDGLGAAATAQILLGGARPPAPCPPGALPRPGLRALRSGLAFAFRFLLPRADWLPADAQTDSDQWICRTAVLDRALFDDLSHRTGASTSHICLTVISGALRAWTPQHWDMPRSRRQRRGLPACLTLSLRAPRDHNFLGNKAGWVPLVLPCVEPSPLQRLMAVKKQADLTEMAPYRNLLAYLLHPPRTLRWLLAQIAAAKTIPGPVITIIPGEKDTADLDDVKELLPVPPRPPGCDGGFVVITQPSTITVHAMFQPHVTDTERLPALLAASMNELHAAATAPPVGPMRPMAPLAGSTR
jgi:hypothetical protein